MSTTWAHGLAGSLGSGSAGGPLGIRPDVAIRKHTRVIAARDSAFFAEAQPGFGAPEIEVVPDVVAVSGQRETALHRMLCPPSPSCIGALLGAC